MASIPPIFHNSKVISDFKQKTNPFNLFFASQCTPVSNYGVLPDISFHISTSLNSFSVTEKDILAIIKSLDPHKSHRWDISMKMTKMCGDTLAFPLKIGSFK